MPYIGHSPEVAQRRYESVDDISGSFNGSTTSFALQVGGVTPAPFPVASENVLISVGGVIQEPDGTGTNGFQLTGTNIVFSSAPAAGQSFFGVILAGADYVTAGHAFPDGDAAGPSITFSQDLDTGVFRAGSGAIGFSGDGSERARIEGSGRLLVGNPTARTNVLDGDGGNTLTPQFQFETANSDTAKGLSLIFGRNNSNGAEIVLGKHRSASVGGTTIVSDGDQLGSLTFSGSDGTNFRPAATIEGNVDATPGSSDMPGRLAFSTTSDGASVPTERVRIDSSGRLLVGTTSAREHLNDGSDSTQIALEGTTQNTTTLSVVRNSNNDGPAHLVLGKSRGGSANSTTVLQSGDTIGHINFEGADGTHLIRAAQISCLVDGAPGANDMPGLLKFSTTPDGSNALAEAMRIDRDGSVGIGITNPGEYHANANDLVLANGMTIANGTTAHMYFADSSTGTGEYVGQLNYQHAHDRFQFVVGNTERARLDDNGSWQTFCTSVNIDISNTQASGTNEAFIYARHGSGGITAGTLSFRVYTNGNVQNSNNSYGSISDQNLKENIIDATSQWDDIKALQVRKYNFREATGHQTHTQLGLIAQEVETVSPGLVETTAVREGETCQDADGNQLESIKSINYSVLYMKAVKALQEAQTRIEALETQNTAQQTTIDDLLARVTALEAT